MKKITDTDYFLAFEQIEDFSEKKLIEIFNGIEDISYAYNENKFDPEMKEEAERYLTNLANWVTKNKNKFPEFEHPYLKSFLNLRSDLDNIDDIVAQTITPVYQETLYNWLGYFKSTDCFYDMQGSHATEVTLLDKVNNLFLENAYKSVKTEKLGSYHLYIISGKASENYIENGTGQYYKENCEKLLKKDLNTIAPAGRPDGEINTSSGVIKLYATSDLNTSSQNVWEALAEGEQTVFVCNGLFNQSYSPTQTSYNDKKARAHGTSFVDQYEFVEFSEQDKGLINVLPVMALLDNIKINKTSLDVTTSDFLKLNPFVVGTDTYFLYRNFRDIKQYNEPDRTEKLLEFTVDYLTEVMDKVSKIKPDYKLTQDTELVLGNIQKTILGVLNNFNKSNLPNELPNEEVLNKLTNVIVSFKNTIGLMAPLKKGKNIFDDSFLDAIDNYNDLTNFLEKRNAKIATKFQAIRVEKVSLKEESKEYIDEILSDFNFNKTSRSHIITVVESRQANNKETAFGTQALGVNTYQFFLNNKDVEPYNKVFKFIESFNDFNDRNVNDQFKNFLRDSIGNDEPFDISPTFNGDLLEARWKSLSNNYYQLPVKAKEIYEFIKEKKSISYYDLYEKFGGFVNMNIIYKETQNSFYKKRFDNDKSKYSNELLASMGLYDIDFKRNRHSRTTYITIEDLEKNLTNSFKKKTYS